MKFKLLGGMAALALLASCSKDAAGSKELAALDKAYQSGVLTKAEYDAKRSGLDAKSAKLKALDKALDDGVLTKDEYQAKRIALLAAADQTAILVVEPGVPAPVQTAAPAAAEPEPPATVAAAEPPPQPQAPAPAVIPPPAPIPANGHMLRMKLVKVVDAQGFEHPITSATLLVPVDWQSQSATTWNLKDSCNTIQTTVHTTGPDGRGFDIFPAFSWLWADEPKALQMAAAQKAQMGTHACDVMPPMSALEYLKRNIGRMRPGAQIVSSGPDQKILQMLQQQAQKTEQAAAQYRMQQHVRPDVVRVRVKYSANGRSMEEWLVAATITTATTAPMYSLQQQRMVQSNSYNCIAYVIAERAPEGQLDPSEKFFDLVNSTFRVNPQWQARITQNAQQMQQIELKGIRDRSAIVAKNADDIRNIQRESYENTQRANDRISEMRSQTMRGVETYRDPTSGETVELSNQYGHAWVNNKGEYLLSDQEGFDPAVTFKEDWRPLEHVKQ